MKINVTTIRKGIRYLKHYGWKEFLIRLQEKQEQEAIPYNDWYEKVKPTEAELAEMEQIRHQLGTNFCRRCNYCAPCTVGISIPSAFLFAGYLERYNLADWAKDRYGSMAVKASACVGCGKCETRCPYHLPIREMLKKVAEEFGE